LLDNNIIHEIEDSLKCKFDMTSINLKADLLSVYTTTILENMSRVTQDETQY